MPILFDSFTIESHLYEEFLAAAVVVLNASVCVITEYHGRTLNMIFVLLMIFVLKLTWHHCSSSAPADLRIAYLVPTDMSDSKLQDVIKHAAELGKQKYLPDTNVTLLSVEEHTVVKEALGGVHKAISDLNADVIYGLLCAQSIDRVGLMANRYNLPLYTAAVSSKLKDITRYATTIECSCSAENHGTAAVRLFDTAQWRQAYMLFVANSSLIDTCSQIFYFVKHSFSRCGITLISSRTLGPVFRYAGHNFTSEMEAAMNDIQTKARVVLLCGPDEFIDDVMSLAYKLDMINGSGGEYIYVAFSALRPQHVLMPWTANGKELDDQTRFIYKHLLQISPSLPENTAAMKHLMRNYAGVPQSKSDPHNVDLKGDLVALVLYDMMLYYMKNIRDLSDAGVDYRDGRAHFNACINDRSFVGIRGRNVMNYRTRRQCDYTVWSLQSDSSQFQSAFQIPLTKAYINATVCTSWLFVSVPLFMRFAPDEPVDGFTGEKRQRSDIYLTAKIIGSLVGSAAVLTGLILGFWLYRKRKYEREVFKMSWKINCDELVFKGDAPEHQEKAALQLRRQSITSEAVFRKRLAFSTTSVNDMSTRSVTRRTADYNGNIVSVKLLPIGYSAFSKEDLLQLKQIKDLNHENLVKFYGVCMSTYTVMLVTSFCGRGTLQDILQNENLKLDDTFKRSFIRELIKGMKYLHRSPVRVHGRLKSSCCLLDSRWMLKITNIGLPRFHIKYYETENEKYSSMLWTAPELVRELVKLRSPYVEGTQPGDVYSFAIVAYEILYQNGPFPQDDDFQENPKVRRLIHCEDPPFRPPVRLEGSNAKLVEIIVKCWDEDPNARPDFNRIANDFATLRNHNVNIIDNVIKMMEDYHAHLEELIDDRACQLQDNIKKTTELLYQMLPIGVVSRLIAGERSFSDNYHEAAVFFSGVSGFSLLSRSCAPLDIVIILDRLFKKLDEIVLKFSVYKVETVEDTYVVGCGVPRLNPRHNPELADMALTMRNAVANFTVPQMNNRRLYIQIGLHCGPLAAGVIGSIRPRYCLFGDTVNMASRMMSTGAAMRIQLSQQMRDALVSTKLSYNIKERGSFDVKGKGKQTTYFLEGRKGLSWFHEYPGHIK